MNRASIDRPTLNSYVKQAVVPVSPVDIKNDAEFEENLDQNVNNSKSFKKA